MDPYATNPERDTSSGIGQASTRPGSEPRYDRPGVGATPAGGSSAAAGYGAGARDLRHQAREMAREVGSTVREQATAVGHEFSEGAQRYARQGKSRVVEHVEAVARGLRSAAAEMRDQDPAIAGWAETACDRLEQTCEYIDRRSPVDMARDAGAWARRHPEVFLPAAILAGALVARFLRASREEDDGYESGVDRYGAPEGAYGYGQGSTGGYGYGRGGSAGGAWQGETSRSGTPGSASGFGAGSSTSGQGSIGSTGYRSEGVGGWLGGAGYGTAGGGSLGGAGYGSPGPAATGGSTTGGTGGTRYEGVSGGQAGRTTGGLGTGGTTTGGTGASGGTAAEPNKSTGGGKTGGV